MRTQDFHGNIVVSNLPEGFTAVELAALFDDFGLVLGAEMDRRRARQGSLILAPEPAVAKAIEALNGQALAGRVLKVIRAPAAPNRTGLRKPPPQIVEPARAPERVAEAVRRFRSTSSEPPDTVQMPPVRQVVVEYRKTRRIEIPPRVPMATGN